MVAQTCVFSSCQPPKRLHCCCLLGYLPDLLDHHIYSSSGKHPRFQEAHAVECCVSERKSAGASKREREMAAMTNDSHDRDKRGHVHVALCNALQGTATAVDDLRDAISRVAMDRDRDRDWMPGCGAGSWICRQALVVLAMIHGGEGRRMICTAHYSYR
jgi:hypothetical protein